MSSQTHVASPPVIFGIHSHSTASWAGTQVTRAQRLFSPFIWSLGDYGFPLPQSCG